MLNMEPRKHGSLGGRIANSFLYALFLPTIVTIESVGSISPQDLFVQAVQVLFDKCQQVRDVLEASAEPYSDVQMS